ncbi:DUF6678 family protein [Paraherbaspirillum soli]|uniref:DUF6678 family protein n=1 Tax=Paraherbaspirillum soli TaxID=631222 RepID=A0ABW0MHD3_9BURK
MTRDQTTALMNNTKWNEIRLAMNAICPSPQYRTQCIDNQYVSGWDHDWLYHFPIGGYDGIEWLEISCDTPQQKAAVLKALCTIHVPGKCSGNGCFVYGYGTVGSVINYL